MEEREGNQGRSADGVARGNFAVPSRTLVRSPELRRVVDILLASDHIRRPALSRQALLPRQTVSDLMSGLESQGLVEVKGLYSGHPGRSGLSYALAASAAVALAYDIGGTKIAAAITDLRGTILAESVLPTQTGSLSALIDQIEGLALELCRRAGIERYRIRHVAAGVPCAINPSGRRVSLATNLPVVADPALIEHIEQRLGCSARLENDANMALIGESYGGGRSQANMAFVALGTGVGAALIVDGRLIRGHRGGAGEIAFLPADIGQPRAGGNFEASVGASGIVAAYRAAGGVPGLTVEDIFDAAELGEAAALTTLAGLARQLAFGIAAMVSVADPEVLVMGGAIGARPELIARVAAALPEFMLEPIPIRSSLYGARAGLVGALCVARRDLLETMFGEGAERPAW